MKIIPVSLKTANAYVARHHRHHKPAHAHKFSIAIEDDAHQLRGVAIAARPSSRNLDNGRTLEITRVCTDGTPNACSKLYAAVRRAARALGYERVITYTLANEPGTSLIAAGYLFAFRSDGGRWDTPSRRRGPTEQPAAKHRYEATCAP